MRKKLPVGIENFEEFSKENFYYIDKTMFITELLNNWGKVNLFTRPRRFGKSLNMGMLKCFFETGHDPAIFDGLEIAADTALCEKYMGCFPVISISLKSVSGADYPTARSLVCSVKGVVRRISFRRYQCVLSMGCSQSCEQTSGKTEKGYAKI